jgi:hypothetical protein
MKRLSLRYERLSLRYEQTKLYLDEGCGGVKAADNQLAGHILHVGFDLHNTKTHV